MNSGKRKFNGENKTKKKLGPSPKADSSKSGAKRSKPSVGKDPSAPKKPYCKFCKHDGHKQKDCDGFKAWLVKKGMHTISMVDESLYIDFSLILGGLTQVPPCTFLTHFRDSLP